jgi:ubiquinone biosynthesis protein UbiJ
MKTNKTIWSGVVGILIGFVAGAVAYPVYQSAAHAQEKKKKKPVVRELEKIGDAISDRNSPVVHQLEEITDELDEISRMQRTLEGIEDQLDE